MINYHNLTYTESQDINWFLFVGFITLEGMDKVATDHFKDDSGIPRDAILKNNAHTWKVIFHHGKDVPAGLTDVSYL